MSKKFTTITAVLACCLGSTPVAADKTLAHSKSLGMSFVALGDPWCAATVNLRVESEDAAKFSTPDYDSIIQRLGQVLAQECPQAGHLNIAGMAAGQLAWSGAADKASGWVARPTAREEPTLAAGDRPATAAEPAAPPSAPPVQTVQAVPAPPVAPMPDVPAMAEPSPAAPQMEIAGWQPSSVAVVLENAGKMNEVTSHETGCNIHTFLDVKPELGPTYTVKGTLACKNGYAQTSGSGQQQIQLFYQGQQQAFARLNGTWHEGYNLTQSYPKQVVRRYRLVATDRWNRTSGTEKLLVWAGEDQDLRAHYFATYSYNASQHQWRQDGTPFIVLTDNEILKRNPEQTRLADSLARMYQEFYGYRENQISNVQFVVTDRMHDTPGHAYQLALSQANPDPSFYKAGRAVKPRGMPWTIETSTDFVAKREAHIEAERKRAEMERQRLEALAEAERQREIARMEAEKQRAEAERQRQAALRMQHQARLNQQYELLASAAAYDQLRFYATLMMARERVEGMKIDFTSHRLHGGNPLDRAVQFTHPAMFIMQAVDGEVNLGGPMYMLVEGKKGHIEKPYPMQVEHNDTSEKIAGWMLVRVAPRFAFSFDKKGRPVFGVGIEEAVSCKSDKCLEEMDAATMMKTWYGDSDMNFAMVSNR